jgi:cell division protein FtsZ
MKPKITVVGVGGAGGNAVNNMISSNLEGCEFLVCNTDAQALEGSLATHKIQLGAAVTRGLGAGANPEVGSAAADESIEEILAYLEGSNMVFVTAGMGGGTGTGAAPVIARAAREAGILTVGVITKPFHFEGTHRMKLAESGIAELQKHVDTLIIIPNQNLFRIANEKTTFADAFRMADEVLQSGVRGVTDLMVLPGLVNLDFADIRAVMAEMGKAMMGMGEAEGERRAVESAEAAISNPLLDDVSMKGARGVLVNITGGLDMTLFEVDEAVNRIREEVDPDANIIFGSTFDQTMQGKMRVSVVATGIEAATMVQGRPLHLSSASVEPARKAAYGTQKLNNSQQSGAVYTPNAQQVREQQYTREHYTQQGGGIPSSILPSGLPSSVVPSQQTDLVGQPSHRQAYQATAQAATPVTAGVNAGQQWQQQAAPQMGQAQPAYAAAPAQTATARKLNEMDESQTWTKPVQPAMTQTYQRPIPAPAARTDIPSAPKGMRHGNSFIPPKPVDPRAATTAADLFAQEDVVTEERSLEKPVKKSPSLFERFTMQRKEEVTAPARTAPEVSSSKLTVEEGGKSEEDELDIPAFLRRQAN